jgi:uncharacterized membrane protein
MDVRITTAVFSVSIILSVISIITSSIFLVHITGIIFSSLDFLICLGYFIVKKKCFQKEDYYIKKYHEMNKVDRHQDKENKILSYIFLAVFVIFNCLIVLFIAIKVSTMFLNKNNVNYIAFPEDCPEWSEEKGCTKVGLY